MAIQIYVRTIHMWCIVDVERFAGLNISDFNSIEVFEVILYVALARSAYCFV